MTRRSVALIEQMWPGTPFSEELHERLIRDALRGQNDFELLRGLVTDRHFCEAALRRSPDEQRSR
jgi:hypothetical protein